MKHFLYILTLLSISLYTFGEELPGYLEDMKETYSSHMSVWAFEDDDYEDEDDNEFFTFKFQSRQDERDEGVLEYQMRVTIQLTDKKTKTVVFAQDTAKPKRLPPPDYYAGHTEWIFEIPFGQLQRPKLTAYAVEFGFMKDGHFVPVATDYDEVDSAVEIMSGEGTKVEMKCTRSAHYRYSEI